VQYRVGAAGPWTDWQVATTETWADYTGTDGLTYYFRSRAVDDAGNLEVYPAGDGDTRTTVQIPVDVGYLQGHVYEDATSLPISGATVRAGAQTTVTDGSGSFSLTLAPGSYTVSVSMPGFAPASASVSVVRDQTTTQDFRLQAQPGWVVGIVRDNATNAPVEGATVSAGGRSATSSTSGAFNLTMPAGFYDLTCSKSGYLPNSIPIAVVAGQELAADCRLDPIPPELMALLRGRVVESGTAQPIEGASVTASGVGSTLTDASGNYDLQVPAGTYQITVTKDGFTDAVRTVTVAAQETRVLDFELEREGGSTQTPPSDILTWVMAVAVLLVLGLLVAAYLRRGREPRTPALESPTPIPTPLCPFCGNEVEVGTARCPKCGGTMTWSRGKTSDRTHS